MQSSFVSLADLAEEVERIENQKQDYLVPSKSMKLYNKNVMDVEGVGSFTMNQLAEGQLSNKLEIPKKFYDKLGEYDGLRENVVNTFMAKRDGKQLVRTLDGNMRAFLSDSYQPMDNAPIMTGILTALKDSGHQNGIKVRGLNLTEQRLYMQISFPMLRSEVVPGDVVEYGITITNSETGCGSVDVSSMVWRLVCSNGLISSSVLRKRHVGRRVDTESMDIFKADTVRAEMESFRLRFRDVLAASMTESHFEKELNLIRAAAGDRIEAPTETVKNVTKHFNLSDKDGDAILGNMVHEMNLTRWGLVNGITALAHSIDNADRQYEVEKLGHDVLTLPRSQWEVLSA